MRRVKGFGLAEVVFGGLLLSSVLMVLALSWQTHQRSFLKSRNRQIAHFVLQAEMEGVLARGYNGVPNITGFPPDSPERAQAVHFGLRDPEIFQVRRTVDGAGQTSVFTVQTAYETSSIGSLRKVLVEVTFQEQNSEPQTFSLESDIFWSE